MTAAVLPYKMAILHSVCIGLAKIALLRGGNPGFHLGNTDTVNNSFYSKAGIFVSCTNPLHAI